MRRVMANHAAVLPLEPIGMVAIILAPLPTWPMPLWPGLPHLQLAGPASLQMAGGWTANRRNRPAQSKPYYAPTADDQAFALIRRKAMGACSIVGRGQLLGPQALGMSRAKAGCQSGPRLSVFSYSELPAGMRGRH